jgi:FkbM family methyltransferase
MNRLLELKESFLKEEITKYDYMEKMNECHRLLFLYRDLIDKSIVKSIQITRDGVVVEVTQTGIKLFCIKDDKGIIPITILNFGHYEERLWKKTVKLLDNPKTIFDIGGNIGYFSLYFSHYFPKAQFYTFEPIPNTFKFLRKNLELNGNQNINAFKIGLSNKKQSMEMFYNPEGSGSSSLRNLLMEKCTKKIICKFSTLDNFVAENKVKNIDFIKCDVEGAEKFVFEGGMQTIQKFKPLIFSEMLRKWSRKFNYHPNEIIKLLKNLNYECYAISDKTFKKIKEVTEDTIETNFIFKASKK